MSYTCAWLSTLYLCHTGSQILIIRFYFKNHIHQLMTSHFPFLLLKFSANLMIKSSTLNVCHPLCARSITQSYSIYIYIYIYIQS